MKNKACGGLGPLYNAQPWSAALLLCGAKNPGSLRGFFIAELFKNLVKPFVWVPESLIRPLNS
ncbi:MAG: hypothetical protein EBU28_08995 [Gammaproteobacteria bacterium]|nr:hypothetical protein [Gammaproteobacteria bacterium]